MPVRPPVIEALIKLTTIKWRDLSPAPSSPRSLEYSSQQITECMADNSGTLTANEFIYKPHVILKFPKYPYSLLKVTYYVSKKNVCGSYVYYTTPISIFLAFRSNNKTQNPRHAGVDLKTRTDSSSNGSTLTWQFGMRWPVFTGMFFRNLTFACIYRGLGRIY